MQGDLEASQDYLARSRELFEDMGAQAKLTEVYRHQAMLGLAQGQPNEALTLAQKSCDLAREIKARVQEGEAMWALGMAFLALEDYVQAQDCLEASLDRFAELNSSYRFAKACNSLALIYLNQPGRKAEGQALLQQSRSIFADMGAAWELAQVEAAIEAAR
jgi:tetratricopeptide (TPR) repeat protein